MDEKRVSVDVEVRGLAGLFDGHALRKAILRHLANQIPERYIHAMQYGDGGSYLQVTVYNDAEPSDDRSAFEEKGE